MLRFTSCFRYLTEAVATAFQNIYDNKANAHDHFTAVWKKLASTFNRYSPHFLFKICSSFRTYKIRQIFKINILECSNSKDYDNILGYELINEPFAGNIYEDPRLVLPGVAGAKNLMPLYNKANTAIRSVQPDALV